MAVRALLMAVLSLGAASASVITSTTFEEGADGFTFNKGTDADATGIMQAEGAGYESANGMRVEVRGSGASPDSVEVLSPGYDMLMGSTYSFSFHGKSEPPSTIEVRGCRRFVVSPVGVADWLKSSCRFLHLSSS